jgi:hypothetical protein
MIIVARSLTRQLARVVEDDLRPPVIELDCPGRADGLAEQRCLRGPEFWTVTSPDHSREVKMWFG